MSFIVAFEVKALGLLESFPKAVMPFLVFFLKGWLLLLGLSVHSGGSFSFFMHASGCFKQRPGCHNQMNCRCHRQGQLAQTAFFWASFFFF
jgi:hypothetical protein